MFTQDDFDMIDTSYFRIIRQNEYAISIQSLNTEHCWHILIQPSYYGPLLHIYHTHHIYMPYHSHARVRSLKRAIRIIQGHDRYQIRKDKKCKIHS